MVARELSQAAPDNATKAAEQFVRFLARHELEHFALEEAVLLPALPGDEKGRSLERRVREDHQYLREALERLRERADPPGAEILHEIGARLRDHVRLEERQLFPHLEQSLEAAELERIGTKLAHRHG